MTATTTSEPDTGSIPAARPRIDLMSRVGFSRPGPSRRKPGPASARSTSTREPKHRAEDR